jgi:hypothetical protein
LELIEPDKWALIAELLLYESCHALVYLVQCCDAAAVV